MQVEPSSSATPPPTGEPLHHAGDDLVHPRLPRCIGRRVCFDEVGPRTKAWHCSPDRCLQPPPPAGPARAARGASRSATGDALLAIDIDNFKRINDEHGHAAADHVLCRLVTAIGARRRSGDLLFRTGGEEFVLLLPRITRVAAQSVAEELRERLAQAELMPGRSVTVSIGISALAPGQSVDTWTQAADAALYEARRAGRNRVVVAAAAAVA